MISTFEIVKKYEEHTLEEISILQNDIDLFS